MANGALLALFAATEACGMVMITIVLGIIMEKRGILHASSRKTISELISELFLPCLLWDSIVPHISWSKLVELWILPLSLIVYTFAGMLVGYIMAKVACVKQDLVYFFFFYILIVILFFNTGHENARPHQK